MKIVLHKGEYKVLDAKNRLAITYKPLNKLEDIFYNNGWARNTQEIIPQSECKDIIFNKGWGIGKFKALKHEVAAYLIKQNNIEINIPQAYINAYNMNSHLYNGRYE